MNLRNAIIFHSLDILKNTEPQAKNAVNRVYNNEVNGPRFEPRPHPLLWSICVNPQRIGKNEDGVIILAWASVNIDIFPITK